MNPQAQAALDKIEKLLAIANHPTTPIGEAEAASAAVVRLLEAYNLDMGAVGKKRVAGARVDKKRGGGLYPWQQSLWYAIAQVNFCKYWSTKDWDPNKPSQYAKKQGYERMGGWTYNHRILGSEVNVAATEVLADYLEDAINRAVRQAGFEGSRYFSASANDFREGCSQAVSSRLWAERRERERAAEQARKPSDGTSLVLMDVIEQEEAANYDYQWGEGAYAKMKARQAQANAEYEKRMEERRTWEKANPEEAKRQRDEQNARWAKEAKKRENRALRRPKKDDTDYLAWNAGHEAGSRISLNKQMDSETKGYLK